MNESYSTYAGEVLSVDDSWVEFRVVSNEYNRYGEYWLVPTMACAHIPNVHVGDKSLAVANWWLITKGINE